MKKVTGTNGTYLAIRVGLSEMKPNTPMLAIITRLITRLPAAIRRYLYPLNTAAQFYAELLGFTKYVQPNRATGLGGSDGAK